MDLREVTEIVSKRRKLQQREGGSLLPAQSWPSYRQGATRNNNALWESVSQTATSKTTRKEHTQGGYTSPPSLSSIMTQEEIAKFTRHHKKLKRKLSWVLEAEHARGPLNIMTPERDVHLEYSAQNRAIHGRQHLRRTRGAPSDSASTDGLPGGWISPERPLGFPHPHDGCNVTDEGQAAPVASHIPNTSSAYVYPPPNVREGDHELTDHEEEDHGPFNFDPIKGIEMPRHVLDFDRDSFFNIDSLFNSDGGSDKFYPRTQPMDRELSADDAIDPVNWGAVSSIPEHFDTDKRFVFENLSAPAARLAPKTNKPPQFCDSVVMFDHYTISEDRSGNQEAIMRQRLAALGNTCGKTKSATKMKKGEEEEQKPTAPKSYAPESHAPKPRGPIDIETHCGVQLPNGGQCARRLICKSHSMGAKRAVPGRSLPYDVLLQTYRKKNQARQSSRQDMKAKTLDAYTNIPFAG